MGNTLMPLYYAIIAHFMDDGSYCAEDVIDALRDDYEGYKLLTVPDVGEALATAKENGLLDEVDCDLGGDGNLRIFYRMSEFGRDMVMRYIGDDVAAAKGA